jgi:hypothetical protein
MPRISIFIIHEGLGPFPFLKNSYLYHPEGLNGVFFGAEINLAVLNYHNRHIRLNILLFLRSKIYFNRLVFRQAQFQDYNRQHKLQFYYPE